MKLEKIVMLLCFLGFTSIITAQITVTGNIADSNHQAIAFANVILLNNTKHIIKGTTTDEKGHFTLTTSKKGIEELQISFIGFKDYKKQIDKSINLGTIVLKEEANSLEGVTINARKKVIEQKVDRTVFNVQNSPFLKGSDGVEILKKVPGINTNDDVISILGKDNVRVMINGRMTTLSGDELTAYLQSLTTKDIEKIEVITTPPAKYEAEGNTGIINIVLKKNQEDYYSGNVKATYKRATYNIGNIMGTYNLKKGKWLFSTYISKYDSKKKTYNGLDIYYPTQKWETQIIDKGKYNNLRAKLSADYMFSKNSFIGFQYFGSSAKDNDELKSNTKIINNQTNVVDSLINTNSNPIKKIYSSSFNTHLQTNLDTLGKTLSVDLDYFNHNDNTEDFIKSYSPNISQSKHNTGKNDVKTYSGKADFELPYKFAKIETGLKASIVKNNSNVVNYDIINDVPIFNNNESNEFKYTEKNQAVYFSASKKFSKKWSSKIGLRFEATQTKGFSVTLNQTTINNYNKLFPTFYINYKYNKNNTFALNYSKRIKRPNFFFLNPFRTDIDLYTYIVGNPLLKPLFINNIKLSHSYKNLLKTSIYYKHVKDGFNQIIILLPNNMRQAIPKNYYSSNQYGITEYISFNVTKFWETSNNIYVYYTKETSTIPEVKPEDKGLSAFIETDNTFILNHKKTIFATLNYWYQFPETESLYQSNAYSQLNLGFKALFLNKKLILNIRGTNLLHTNTQKYTSYDSNNIKQAFSNHYDNRQLILSLAYRFGNNKIKAKSHTGSNQEEKNRAN